MEQSKALRGGDLFPEIIGSQATSAIEILASLALLLLATTLALYVREKSLPDRGSIVVYVSSLFVVAVRDLAALPVFDDSLFARLGGFPLRLIALLALGSAAAVVCYRAPWRRFLRSRRSRAEGHSQTGSGDPWFLFASDGRFSKVLERMSEMFIFAAPDWSPDRENTKPAYVAGAVKDILGISPDELLSLEVNQFIARFIHAEDREFIVADLAQGFYDSVNEYRIVRDDGSVIHVRSTRVMVCDDDGKLRAGGCIIQDVTKKIQLARELDVERARSLQANRLSSLGEMAAGAAHEIRNPLFTLRSFLMLVERDEGGLSDSNRSALSAAVEAGGQIEAIVSSLALFARDDSDAPPMTTPVADLVLGAASLVRQRFELAGIDLAVATGRPGLSAACRPGQITRVLHALLLNSLDAVSTLDSRWVRIEVTVAQVETAENVRFRVTDAGPGIPPEIAGKLSLPFFTTKEVGHGMGLSLSSAYGIAVSHGGRLYYDPSVENTSFVLELPVASVVEPGFSAT